MTMWIAVVCCMFMTAGRGYASDMPRPEASDDVRVYDLAGILDDSREKEFEKALGEYREQYRLDMAVVTTDDAQGKSTEEYADDFYGINGFGVGSDRDGILFLIDMDNRELTFSTAGKAIRIFTDERIEDMLDGVYEGASRGDYEASVDSFLADAARYCRAGIPGNQHSYDTETGEISVHKSIRWYEALIALGVSGFVAGAACLAVKRQYAMEEDAGQLRNLNMAYRSEARFVYNNQTDRLVNKFVTSRVIPRSTSGGGRGGGHSTAGRSSTHTSSGGMTHGGGSRKF